MSHFILSHPVENVMTSSLKKFRLFHNVLVLFWSFTAYAKLLQFANFLLRFRDYELNSSFSRAVVLELVF